MQHIRITIASLMAAARAKFTVPFPSSPSDVLYTHRATPQMMDQDKWLSHHERADWQGSPLVLRQFYARLYRRMRKLGYPIYCHTCLRDPNLQRHLYEAGNSQLASGAHQRSGAIDVVHSEFHWAASKDFWILLGQEAKAIAAQMDISIVWGGDWSTLYDPAHFELLGWRHMPEVVFDPAKVVRVYPRAQSYKL